VEVAEEGDLGVDDDLLAPREPHHHVRAQRAVVGRDLVLLHEVDVGEHARGLDHAPQLELAPRAPHLRRAQGRDELRRLGAQQLRGVAHPAHLLREAAVRGEPRALGRGDLGAHLLARPRERLDEVAHALLAARELGRALLLAAAQALLRLHEELLGPRGQHLARQRLELGLEATVVALDLLDAAVRGGAELGELLLVGRAREVEPLVRAALRRAELAREALALGLEPLGEARGPRRLLLRLAQELGEPADLRRGGVGRRAPHAEHERDAAHQPQHETDSEEQPPRDVHGRTMPRGTDTPAGRHGGAGRGRPAGTPRDKTHHAGAHGSVTVTTWSIPSPSQPPCRPVRPLRTRPSGPLRPPVRSPVRPCRRTPPPRSRCAACGSGSVRRSRSPGSTWTSRRARSTGSSDPTAPARRRRCPWPPGSCVPTPAPRTCTAPTCGPTPPRASASSACCPTASGCSTGSRAPSSSRTRASCAAWTATPW